MVPYFWITKRCSFKHLNAYKRGLRSIQEYKADGGSELVSYRLF